MVYMYYVRVEGNCMRCQLEIPIETRFSIESRGGSGSGEKKYDAVSRAVDEDATFRVGKDFFFSSCSIVDVFYSIDIDYSAIVSHT